MLLSRIKLNISIKVIVDDKLIFEKDIDFGKKTMSK